MSKLAQRLLLFFVGLPLLVFSIIAADYYHFLLLHIFICISSIIATNEVYIMVGQRLSVQPKPFVLVISALIPIFAAFAAVFELPFSLITYVFTLSFIFCAVYEIFIGGKKDEVPFKDSISRITSTTFILLYTGLLFTYLSRMTVWQFAPHNIGLFVLMVYGCDSIAWFFGMTMGKNNRGIFAVSPNKSLAGFIGGFTGSILIGILAKIIFPHVFYGSWFKIIALSFLVALAAILGDLAESVLKRSGQIKDSGKVIPGRGGMMDSIDSLLFAIPVYYFMASLLYNFTRV